MSFRRTTAKSLAWPHLLLGLTTALWSSLAIADEGLVQSPVDAWPPAVYVVSFLCGLVLVVIIVQFVLFFFARDRITPGDITRAFSTPLIIITVVALVGIGYGVNQIQPVLGLIGTLIGYLMGRGETVSRGSGHDRHEAVNPPDA
jgi:hypothetical protein